MTSAIDPLVPPQGEATTAAVRQNFATAKGEIESLQTTAASLAARVAVGHVRTAGRWGIPAHLLAYSWPATTPTSRRMYLFPFIPSRDITIDALSFLLSNGTGGSWSGGVYDSTVSNGSDQPLSLLGSTEPVITTGAGTKIGALSLTLASGRLYWMAAQFSSSPQVYWYAGSGFAPLLGIDPDTLNRYSMRYADLGSNGLPAVCPATIASSLNVPTLFFREA